MSKLRQKEVHVENRSDNGEQTETVKNVPNALTLYVIFSILVILIYTIVEMFISTQSGISHDTLTTCFYSVFGGEILCCALIKIFKLKSKDSGDEETEINSREG